MVNKILNNVSEIRNSSHNEKGKNSAACEYGLNRASARCQYTHDNVVVDEICYVQITGISWLHP